MILVTCPWCECLVEIEEINCAIFRHAIDNISYNQINPHESKEICDSLVENNKIHGCGKPFRVVSEQSETSENDKFVAVKCDYI